MSTKNIIGYLIVIIVLIAGLTIWGSRQSNQATTSINNPDRPQAIANSNEFDFGTMTNQDIRDHEFIITNHGQENLVLSRVSTSCDCTYAYITTADTTSPKFTMHGMNNWSATLKTGEQATVKVIYEPAIMPAHGTVTRTVAVTTNDPGQPTVSFTIKANVTD